MKLSPLDQAKTRLENLEADISKILLDNNATCVEAAIILTSMSRVALKEILRPEELSSELVIKVLEETIEATILAHQTNIIKNCN